MNQRHRVRRMVLVALVACASALPPGAVRAATTPQRCAARKLDATARAVVASLGCHAHAVHRGTAVQASCLVDVAARFAAAFRRNMTTAALMDFGPTIEPRPEITYFVYDEAARCDHSYVLLAAVPAPGTNTAIIGHAGFSCPVLGSLAWSEAAIFKPDGAGGSELVTRIPVSGWADLP